MKYEKFPLRLNLRVSADLKDMVESEASLFGVSTGQFSRVAIMVGTLAIRNLYESDESQAFYEVLNADNMMLLNGFSSVFFTPPSDQTS